MNSNHPHLGQDDDYTVTPDDVNGEEELARRLANTSDSDPFPREDSDSEGIELASARFMKAGTTLSTGDSATFSRKLVQWTTSDGRNFIPSSQTVKKLPPALYEIHSDPQVPLYFQHVPVKMEGLLRFPDTNSDIVVAEIEKF